MVGLSVAKRDTWISFVNPKKPAKILVICRKSLKITYMPLLEIWKATKDSVLKMNLETIVKMAGDGQLKDGSETSLEFRQFLTEVDSKKLAEYATYCTDHAGIPPIQ